VIVAWIAVTSVSKSATSWLIDTFITAVSSTIRNIAVPSTASGFHRPTSRSPRRQAAQRRTNLSVP